MLLEVVPAELLLLFSYAWRVINIVGSSIPVPMGMMEPHDISRC